MPCSNAAKTPNPLEFAGVPQTNEKISAASGPKFTILWGHVEKVLLLKKFFPIVDACLICEDIARQSCAMVPRWRFLATFLWPPYVIGGPLYFCPVVSFYLLSSFYLLLFFSPNLSGHRLDVYHTLSHGVALVRIWNAGLKCAARGSLQMQDPKKLPKIAIWAPSHNFVGLYLCN